MKDDKQLQRAIFAEIARSIDKLSDGDYSVVFPGGSADDEGLGLVVDSLNGLVQRLRSQSQVLPAAVMLSETSRLQTLLADTSQRLAAALESKSLVIWDLDVETDVLHISTIIDGNAVFVPVPCREFVERVYADDRRAFEELIQEDLRSEKTSGLQFRLHADDGSIRWRHTSARRYVHRAGKVARVIGTSFDITDMKARELEIADERLAKESLFSRVINGIPAMVSYWDRDMRNVFANEMYARIFNRPATEIKGMRLEDLIGPKNFAVSRPGIETVLRGEKRTVIRILPVDGQERTMRIHFEPDFTPSGVNGYFIIGLDVTDEAQLQAKFDLERAKSLRNAKLASLGEMSAGIAHEINNPLAIIAGSLYLLKKTSEGSDKFKQRLEDMDKAAQRIAKIVNGLRKFSRSSDGPTPHEVVPISRIIGEAITLTAGKARQHSMVVEWDSEVSGAILCAEIEVEQVLVNLINNAIDAVCDQPTQWVKLTVFARGEDIVLQLRDSGPGIPESVRLRLFEPFFTTKPVGQGTGLGLSIAKGILDDHKASIEVLAGDPNTCFEIHFRAAKEVKDDA